MTKEEKREYDIIYRANNKEKIKENNKRWAAENKERQRGYHKNWRTQNKDRIRSYTLKAKYDLSLEQYAELLAKQDGACALCRNTKDKTLYVDHDHVTGAVRGLLCARCNTGLGQLGDREEFLLRAINYLKKQ